MRFALLLALCFASVGLAWADDEKKEEKRADPLAGTWKVTKFETDGQAADVGESSLAFKDGKYTVVMGGKEVESGAYKIDASKKPATLDFDIKAGSDKGKKQPGLFKIDGDKLIVALALPGAEKRPEKIESGDGVVYAELKKAKE